MPTHFHLKPMLFEVMDVVKPNGKPGQSTVRVARDDGAPFGSAGERSGSGFGRRGAQRGARAQKDSPASTNKRRFTVANVKRAQQSRAGIVLRKAVAREDRHSIPRASPPSAHS